MVPGGSNGSGLAKRKPVIQYDLKGNKVAEYPSIKNAADTIGVSRALITKCVSFKYLCGNGYQWRYADDMTPVKDISAQAKKTNIKICQYSLDWTLIQKFSSLQEASSAVGCSKSAICAACERKIKTVKGYFWRYEGDFQESDRLLKVHSMVLQFDKNKKLIQNFISVSEASRLTGVNLSNISQCCEGHRKTAGGFIWEYQD